MSSFGIKEASTKGSVFASREERGSKYQFRAEMPTSFFSLRSSDMERNYGNVFCGKTSAHFSLFWGKLDLIYIAKTRKKPLIQIVTKERCKNKWAYISVHVMGDLWRLTQELWRNICSFPSNSMCISTGLTLHKLQQAGFTDIKSVKKQGMWPNGKLACPNFFWNVLQASMFKCVSWNILFTPLPVN